MYDRHGRRERDDDDRRDHAANTREPGLAPAALLSLQRTAGNRAVARLFDKDKYTQESHFTGAQAFKEALDKLPYKDKRDCYAALKQDETVYKTDEEIIQAIRKWRKQESPDSVKDAKPKGGATGEWPSMARIENPDWSSIEPLLAGYGITDAKERERIKQTLEKALKSEQPIPIRGITDLIGRALGRDRLEAAASAVRADNARVAPNLGTTRVPVGRGDTRPPAEIKEVGGLFGWDAGIVTIAHARSIAKQVKQKTLVEQTKWANSWKRPTPPPEERNPWVATGKSAEGGQKGGEGEYFAELPLTFEVNADPTAMVIGTDTGSIDTASVIGVKLDPQSNGKGDEVIVLTGIPWKYITGWEGVTELGKPRAKLTADAAATATQAKWEEEKKRRAGKK